MLKGIDPVLHGDLLRLLDQMGHSDTVAVVDAHFPAYRISGAVIDVAVDAPRAVQAVCSVLELDDVNAATLMDSAGPLTECQQEIIAALGDVPSDRVRSVERYAYYDEAAKANFIIRTTEVRTYGNVLLSKGVTPSI
jgi:Fucose dissimilation pathway protein FucU